MKFSHIFLAAVLACEATALLGMGSKAAYNKWNENELERWLSDHNVPYSTPADRKELEKLVKEHWSVKVVIPYSEWEPQQLQKYLSEKGQQVDAKKAKEKSWLVENVKKAWEETENTAEEAYGSIKNWIFDSWSESQLKAFLDRHGIPNPQPRTRDTLLSTARDNYDTVANKLGETTAYPGNWLYESWSDSDLKKWLDTHGYPAPQPSTRDKLIASVRRNSRLTSLKLQSASDSAAYHANNAKNYVADSVFDSWSDSKLKEFLDKNSVKIPQGSTRNELLALARRNKAYYTGDTLSASASSAYDSASSYGGQKVAQATDTAAGYKQEAFDTVINQWSDSRLKEYLDSRGVPVPQNGKRDELLAKVRLNKHKAATGFGAWTFDTWTYDNLKKWLDQQGYKASSNAAASRDELYSSAVSAYSAASSSAASAASVASKSASSAASVASKSASSAGTEAGSSASSAATKATDSAHSAGSSAGTKATDAAYSAGTKATDAATDAAGQAYASITSALAKATDSAKDVTFDTWSDSELKAYLDRYGINTYQGSTRNELIAAARRNAHAFRYGSGDQGVYGQVTTGLGWVKDRIFDVLGFGAKKAEVVGDKTYEAGQRAGDRAYEAGQKAYDSAKEKATEAKDRVKEEL